MSSSIYHGLIEYSINSEQKSLVSFILMSQGSSNYELDQWREVYNITSKYMAAILNWLTLQDFHLETWTCFTCELSYF